MIVIILFHISYLTNQPGSLVAWLSDIVIITKVHIILVGKGFAIVVLSPLSRGCKFETTCLSESILGAFACLHFGGFVVTGCPLLESIAMVQYEYAALSGALMITPTREIYTGHPSPLFSKKKKRDQVIYQSKI